MNDDSLQIVDALMQLVIALNVEGTTFNWLLLHILVLAWQVDGVLANKDWTIATRLILILLRICIWKLFSPFVQVPLVVFLVEFGIAWLQQRHARIVLGVYLAADGASPNGLLCLGIDRHILVLSQILLDVWYHFCKLFVEHFLNFLVVAHCFRQIDFLAFLELVPGYTTIIFDFRFDLNRMSNHHWHREWLKLTG